MKYTGALLFTALVLGVVLFVGPAPMPEYSRPGKPTPPTSATPSESDQFIALCSGLDVSDEAVKLLGLSNCLGRLRGFVDGHQLTVQLMKSKDRMWCVDADVKDKEVFDAVIDWAVENPKQVSEITRDFEGINAATAIAIRAIHHKFPCKV